MDQTYTLMEVSRILRTPPARIRALVEAGLCTPQRHGRKSLFSFKDLSLFRTALGLVDPTVPPRRLAHALTRALQQLPPGHDLRSIRLFSQGRELLARDERATWTPESGQTVFAFEAESLPSEVMPLPSRHDADAQACFEHALEVENSEPDTAKGLYQQALALNPGHADACVNLGRLTYQDGQVEDAVRLYEQALALQPDDAVAHYNLALALDDLGFRKDAIRHYQRALTLDGTFAEAHFNLARLMETAGQKVQALRHLSAYRRLVDGQRPKT